MAKRDLVLNPGDQLPIILLSILNDYFSDLELEKLRKFGGRIQISLTAPYTDKSNQENGLEIDEKFLSTLKAKPTEAKKILQSLTKEQLAFVAKSLHFPTSSKANAGELRKLLFDFINSKSKWEEISSKI